MDSFTPPPDAQIVDCENMWIVPGLADAHVHLLFNPADPLLFLANGITTVRDMASPTEKAKGSRTLAWDDHVNLRSEISSGKILGPTLYISSPIHEARKSAYFDRRIYLEVRDAEEGVQTVQDTAAKKFDYYKVYNKLPKEAFLSAAAEAQRIGIPVVGHVPHDISIEEILETKLLHSIEHLTGYLNPFGDFKISRSKLTYFAELTSASGVWNVPTLEVWRNVVPPERIADIEQDPWTRYIPKSTREIWRSSIESFTLLISKKMDGYDCLPSEHMEDFEILFRTLFAAKAQIAAGTDSGTLNVVGGSSLHKELQTYVRLGMTPYEAIETATVNAARCLADDGTFGVIVSGARADLLILEGNPIADIINLSSIKIVVVRGTPYPQVELIQMLDAVASGFPQR
jgi:hypothetical protein